MRWNDTDASESEKRKNCELLCDKEKSANSGWKLSRISREIKIKLTSYATPVDPKKSSVESTGNSSPWLYITHRDCNFKTPAFPSWCPAPCQFSSFLVSIRQRAESCNKTFPPSCTLGEFNVSSLKLIAKISTRVKI